MPLLRRARRERNQREDRAREPPRHGRLIKGLTRFATFAD